VNRVLQAAAVIVLAAVFSAAGCQSPYRADQGALFGGLLGAGTGAIVGDAVGNAGTGTAIGAGIGALTGAAVGSELDQIEARNRAMIEQQLGRQLAAGATTMNDVMAMSAAGVDDELIINHIRAHGVAAPLQTEDVILLHKQGVSTRVIKTMQNPPPGGSQPVSVGQPQPVIVEEYHYGPPLWGPPCYPRHYRWGSRPRPGISWGVSVGN